MTSKVLGLTCVTGEPDAFTYKNTLYKYVKQLKYTKIGFFCFGNISTIGFAYFVIDNQN